MDIMDIAVAKALAGEGGGSGGSVFYIELKDGVLNKTFKEILDAMESGLLVRLRQFSDEDGSLLYEYYDVVSLEANVESSSYVVNIGNIFTLETDSENGYPQG